MPAIINMAFKKRLFDTPAEWRKIHTRIVPNFGGIAIFTGFLFSSLLFIPSAQLPEASRVLAAGLILFMVGLNDDMVNLGPKVKFLVQSCSALIIAIGADIRIEHLQGFLGFGQLDYVNSVLFTLLVIVGIVNAFNLIDGIDGLAASLGILVSLVFAYLFWNAGYTGWSCLAISLTGSLLGFLIFNVSPARIFMGDSGSLFLGLIAVVLSVKYLQISGTEGVIAGPVKLASTLPLVLSTLIIPVFDTLRVFLLRVLSNKSPFKADNNHLHHRLLGLGFSHMQTTLILVIFNALFVILASSLSELNTTQSISVLVLTIVGINGLLSLYIGMQKKRETASVQLLNSKTRQKEKTFADEVLEQISEN